jgi:hypothetical protein
MLHPEEDGEDLVFSVRMCRTRLMVNSPKRLMCIEEDAAATIAA